MKNRGDFLENDHVSNMIGFHRKILENAPIAHIFIVWWFSCTFFKFQWLNYTKNNKFNDLQNNNNWKAKITCLQNSLSGLFLLLIAEKTKKKHHFFIEIYEYIYKLKKLSIFLP